MATKTTKSKSKAEPKNEEPKFSYEFFEMLIDTASSALNKHLEKNKVPNEVKQLFELICCLYLEQLYVVEGIEQNIPWASEIVADTVRYISAVGGEWHAPSGSITSLKEWRANRAKG